jgi:hypothetical protein
MSRKLTYTFDFGLVTGGWISVEPTDIDRFERVYKKTIREGEERLMLAVLEEAVQCYQEYVLSSVSVVPKHVVHRASSPFRVST